MSDISKINPNGTEYNLKDATARAGIESSKTLKSSVVTVTDAAPINAEDITVDITPIQDLHGYDRPWAGGAWKNKLDTAGRTITTNSSQEDFTHIYCEACTATKNGDTLTATITGAWSKLRFKFDTSKLTNGQTYTISALLTNPDAQTVAVGYYNGSWHVSTISTSQSVRPSITFTYDSSWSSLVIGVMINNTAQNTGKTVTVKEIQLEQGSSATAYAPYSNECPLEGWTGAELDRVGKNSCREVEQGTFTNEGLNQASNNRIRDKYYERVDEGKTYTIKATASKTLKFIISYYTNDDYITPRISAGTWVNTSLTFTVPSGIKYVRCVIAYADDTNINPSDISEYQLELGSTATTYEPYQGQQYTASFGETVYGGKWHVTEGGTDKTYANIASYNGETINEPWLSSMDEYVAGATPTTGAQVVYPLTTPTTISTPKQNVPMLQGINTVSADCGDTQLKYQPDNVVGELKGEIRAVEAELAEVEENLEIVYEDHVANTSMGIIVQDQAVGDMVFSNALDIAKPGYIPIAVTDTSIVHSTVANQGEIATHCLLDVTNNRVRFYVHVMDSAASLTIPPNSLTFRVAYKKA